MTSTIPDWDRIHLGDLVTDIRYGTSEKSNNLGRGYPVLRIPNVMEGKIDVSDLRYIEGSYADLKRYRIENADILLVRTNANPDYIGRCALIKGNDHEWLFASYLLRIQVDASRVLPEFLVRYLQGNEIRRRIRAFAHTSAGNYNININDVRSLPILLPPLHEQNRIVEMLRCVDRYLTITAGIKSTCSNLKNGLMQRLLTRGIGHTRFKKTKIGDIPESWGEIMKLENYLYVKGRIGWRGLKREEYTDDGPFLISGFNLIDGKIDWKSCFHLSQFRYEESPEIMLQQDDIIMTKDGTIGRLGFIDKLPGPSTINATMMLVRVQTADFLPKFIYYMFQGPQFQRIIQEKTSGSAVPHIFQRDIKGFLIPRVPLQEQVRIVNILETLDKKIQVEHSLEKQPSKLKKGLMQVLLTGKVRVKTRREMVK